eukprot:gene8038-9442_t
MFKKGLDVLNKTKDAAKASIVEQPDETENIQTAKASIKNMKWTCKYLIELSRTYYSNSDKQVQHGNTFSGVLSRFGEKTSHTNYIANQTVPLSVALREVGACVKDSSLLFQQYTQVFCDRLANQITALYEGSVKKVVTLEKQQEEIRNKFNLAASNLKSAQKNNKQVTERQAEYDNAKAIYDQTSANLEAQVLEMVTYVQREVAVALKQFVNDQKRFIEEGIRMWTEAENKIFGVESPQPNTNNNNNNNNYSSAPTYTPPAVDLNKLSLQEPSPEHNQSPPAEYHSPPHQEQEHYAVGQTPPQQQANPFDDVNPFESQ